MNTFPIQISSFPCQYVETRPITSLGRTGRAESFTALIYKHTMKPLRPPPKETKVYYNTVRQVVMHFHQMTLRRVSNHISASNFLRQDAYLLLIQPTATTRAENPDFSRPSRSAQLLIRLFSKESAQRELRPFYSSVVRNVLREEQERYKSRPSQAISLVWNLFGRQQAFRTLTQFYMGAVEKLGSNYYPALTDSNALYLAAGVVLHSRIYQRYIRQIWNRDSGTVPVRYTPQEQAVTEDLLRLPVARRLLPPKEALEQVVSTEQQPGQRPETTGQDQSVHLSEADFRALVQGVATTLGQQARLEALRRGGM